MAREDDPLDPRVQVVVLPPSDPAAAGHDELQGIGSGDDRPEMAELADRPWITQAMRVAMVVAVVYGSLRAAANAWTLGDIGVGLMSWLNLAAILVLQKPALLALKDYEAQKKAGKDPTFDPEALGIKNATFWSERK